MLVLNLYEPDFVQAVFEAVQCRGNDNSRSELDPATDYSVTEEVMSSFVDLVLTSPLSFGA